MPLPVIAVIIIVALAAVFLLGIAAIIEPLFNYFIWAIGLLVASYYMPSVPLYKGDKWNIDLKAVLVGAGIMLLVLMFFNQTIMSLFGSIATVTGSTFFDGLFPEGSEMSFTELVMILTLTVAVLAFMVQFKILRITAKKGRR